MLKCSHLNVMGHDLHQLHTQFGRVRFRYHFDRSLCSSLCERAGTDRATARSYLPSPRWPAFLGNRQSSSQR